MKVLLTGAFGNIGTYCLQELIRQQHQVRCLHRKSKRAEKIAAKFAGQTEIVWGDVRDVEAVRRATSDQEVIIHLAYILPPNSDEKPELAQAVNVDGTQNLIEAAEQAAKPPRFLFASSFVVFGHTQKQVPPRKVTDPIIGTDPYSCHKLICEKMVSKSGLEWLILRLPIVVVIALQKAHPIMFEIGLDTRTEVLHPADAGLAIVNALRYEAAWGKILLLGGGPTCQLTFREYFTKLLTTLGIGAFPEQAYCQKEYYTDWLDTAESQQLLDYQRHSFDDILAEIGQLLGYRRYIMPLVRPFVSRSLLKLSPYWSARAR
jgi:nucleoside-diphosphate-sugar epimerase